LDRHLICIWDLLLELRSGSRIRVLINNLESQNHMCNILLRDEANNVMQIFHLTVLRLRVLYKTSLFFVAI
jgi:hypothetical protein